MPFGWFLLFTLSALSYIFLIGRSMSVSPYTSWLSKISESDVLMTPLGTGGVVTVDMGGYVRLWETGLDTLQRSLMEWRNMIGTEDSRPIQVTSTLCFGNLKGFMEKLLCTMTRRGLSDLVKCLQTAVSLNTTEGQYCFKYNCCEHYFISLSAYLPHSDRIY